MTRPTGRQYPEMPAAIVQPFNRLVSEGMGRDVEEKVVILQDHILKSARQRCGITSMAQLQPKTQVSTGQGKVGLCSSNSGPAEFDLTGKESKPCTTVHIFLNTTLDARWDLRALR